MSSAVESLRPPRASGWPWIPASIIAIALLVGLALGDPSPERLIPLGVAALLGVYFLCARWPFASLCLMVGSTILLVVVRLIDVRSINLIDLLMVPVLLVTFARGLPREVRLEFTEGEPRLIRAERRLTGTVIVFFVLAALSLVRLATLAGTAAALDSGLLLFRHLQGLVFYPLCLWWVKNRQRTEGVWRAIVVAGFALAIVNIIGVMAWDVKRAGMTLYLNDPEAPLSTPNEAGTASLIVGAVLIIRQLMRPDWKNFALGALMLAFLGLTQSRSGILAWVTFALFTLRWIRPSRILAGVGVIAVILPLMPSTFWARMFHSLAVKKGTFEAYSMYFRFYAWRSAWNVVQEHPLFGVGYLGYRFVSHTYNQFRVVITTVENYYYEVLVSMGVVGLVVLAVVILRLYQVGREVGRVARPGTLAYHMARFHAPLVTGLLVANLTGDNFMGMVGLGQLAIWTAVLVRSGHAASREAAAP